MERPPDSQRVAELSFVAFDIEATGYSNVTDRVVELAGVRFRRAGGGWVEEGRFESLVRPGRSMCAEVIAVHGIDDATAAAAPEAREVLPRFFAFAEGAVWLAHYAAFDVGILAFTCERDGLTTPDAYALDTFPLPRRLLPGLPNYALGTLCHHLGIAAFVEHRALPDAVATRSLFEHCVARVGDPEQVTLGDLAGHCGPLLAMADFTAVARALPDNFERVHAAVSAGAGVALEYRGGSKGRGPRPVTPSHLFAREGHVFLEAMCHIDGVMKSYRLDRIGTLTPLGPEPAPFGTTS